MKRTHLLFLTLISVISCEKEAQKGYKKIQVNVTNSENNEGIDSINCLIVKQHILTDYIIQSGYTDTSGSCELGFTFDYRISPATFLELKSVSNNPIYKNITFSGNEVNQAYYRNIKMIPKIDFSQGNYFKADLKLLPVSKLNTYINTGNFSFDLIRITYIENDEKILNINSLNTDSCCNTCTFLYYGTTQDSVKLVYTLEKNKEVISKGTQSVKLEKFQTKDIEVKFE